MKIDAITQEIIQSSLRATSEEMFLMIAKTAMSPIIYEVLDMATAITTADGELASAGSGIPAFVGALDKTVQVIISKFGLENIHDGDIYVTNDPYFGGVTHLNDVIFVKPIFAEQQLIAWTANIAHWNDVSGKSAGSMSPDASDIYQEGIRIPAIKIFENDTPIDSVLDIISHNSRMPDFLQGDLWAQIAALRLGSRRLQELTKKFSVSLFLAALDNYLDFGEAKARAAVSNLPDGTYELVEPQDDDSQLAVSIAVSKDHLTIDLTQAPDQVAGPLNLSRDGTLLACRMLLLSLVGDRDASNGGSFRTLEVLTRPGSIYDVQAPGACGIYFETMIRLNDVLWRCLAEQIPGALPAGNFASICATILGGKHPDSGQHYSIVEPEMGGWGASATGDGANAVFSAMHGDTFNCPAEIAEVRYGVAVDQVALNPEESGAGEYRGGKGIVIDYRIKADDSFLTCAYTRSVVPPWGLNGGLDGSTNRIEIIRPEQAPTQHAMESELTLQAGDTVRVITANGAGYGNPKARDRQTLQDDIRNGYISAEYAEKVYGWQAQ